MHRAFLLLLALISGCSSLTDGDRTLFTGRILTMDPEHPEATALLVEDGKIVAFDEAATAKGPFARTIRIPEGSVLMPGIIESHAHFLGVGRAARQLELQGTTSEKDVLARVATWMAARPAGDWILGRGWNQEDWPSKRFPTRELLDRVAPDQGVMLRRVDGHAAWVNSKALELAGIGKDTVSPPGGEILRQANGEATGILVDRAMELVEAVLPPETDPERVAADFLEAQRRALDLGITTFVDAGIGPRNLAIVEQLYREGKMKLRLYFMHSASTPADVRRITAQPPLRSAFDGRLDARAVKMYADGALGSRGAWLLEDYSDRAGHRGFPITQPEELESAAAACLDAGYQLCVHAIGDRANREVLNAFERALRRKGEPSAIDHRFRIEHAQIVHPDDLPRFAGLGVLPSMQTCHAASDGPWADQRLGRARLDRAGYQWRTLIGHGSIIPNGTDAPVEALSPWINLHAALLRAHPGGAGFAMDQRLRREEALASLTRWGAFGCFQEGRRGQLVSGAVADLVLIDRDPLHCATGEIPKIRAQRVWIAGEELTRTR